MTARAKTTLAALFQTGDTPSGTDFADLIDSSVNLVETTAQTVASKLVISGGTETTTVSANTATFTGAVSAVRVVANSAQVTDMQILGVVSASAAWATTLTNTSATIAHGAITRLGVGTASPSEGLHISVSGDTNLRIDVSTTVVASAGVSGPATPASVAGFLPVRINGVKRMIAFYNA